jgi:hypothetical protein
MSSILKSIFNPIKNLATSAGNKLTQAVLGNFNSGTKNTGVFTNLNDIKNQLNDLEGKERRTLIDSLLDEFNIKDLRNSETDNVIRILERKLKEDEDVPEANFNEQLFEVQNPLINIGQNKSLNEIFKNNPNARVLIKNGNNQPFYISKAGFEKWKTDRELGIDQDYNDIDLNQNVEVLDINNPDLLDFRRIERKNEVGGIDDLRINIEEFENDDYYCPTNLSCIKKCIIKYLEIKNDEENLEKIKEIDLPDVGKSNTINKKLQKHELKYRIAFSYKRYQAYKKEEGIEPIPIKEVELRGVGVGYSHSILLKRRINGLYKNDSLFKNVIAHKIELENVEDFSRFIQERYYENINERGEIIQVPFFKPDSEVFEYNPLNIMAFDYEAHQVIEETNKMKNGIFMESEITKQYPYMVSYAYRKSDGNIKADYIWNMEDPIEVNNGLLKVIQNRVMELVKESTKKPKKEGMSYQTTLTMVSHNGAGYDHHVFLRFLDNKDILVKSYIGDESKIKTFEITFKNIKASHSVRFVDSYLFTTKSLDDSCKAFGVEGKKEGIDISKILVKEDILKHKKEVIEYGIQDSRCLLKLVENINKSYKDATGIDLSPFRYISLPSYAGKIRDTLSNMRDIRYHTRREIVDFEQGSVYGGRLVVGSLNSKELMRNPDINSLYPTAMANYEYPCGPSELVRNRKKCKKLCKLFNKQKYELTCILKCKVKVNRKCIIPMIPNKMKDGSIDTTQSEFICTVTNVELQEAIKHGGYEVLEVYMYEEWKEKKYIFKDFIEKMYNKRLEYKKQKKEATNDNDKKKYDILQELCKLIMNSSFGKIIQKPIDSQFNVTTVKEWTNEIADQHTEYIQCINGKRNVLYRKKNKDVHDNKLPKYLGAFILSYSKKHMNDYISAVDGFYKPVIKYMDTDSLYFDVKYFDMLSSKGLIGPALGQATPDYDVDIQEYVSLGKKIKFCKLTNGDLKTTFKGFSRLNKMDKEDKLKFFEELKEIADDNKLSKDCKFMSKTITRLNKRGLDITVQELSRDFKPTWESHYKKENNWLYPKYYLYN